MAEGYETHKALYTYSDPENPQILPIREGDYLEELKGIEPPEGWILMRWEFALNHRGHTIEKKFEPKF